MKVLEKGSPCTVQWRPRSMFTVYSTVPLTHVLVNPTYSLYRDFLRHLSTFLFFPTSPGLSCPAFRSWDSPFPNAPIRVEGTQQPLLLPHTPSLKAFRATLPLRMPVPPSSTGNAFCGFRPHPFLSVPMSPWPNTVPTIHVPMSPWPNTVPIIH